MTAAPARPHRDLGLTDDEYARIVATLGREPTDAELAMYSVMWSEHCSYKSSKVHLRQLRDTAPPSDRLLAGMGENAGVVAVSEGFAVTFKIESHNHPSFVEPYQGAATGVGGIVRDVLAMGARPVAVLDPLRFGDADAPDTARVLPGVVAGIGGYGNCLGLPTIGGEVVFDPTYAGNPLVNALCVGVLPADRIQTSAARGVGDAVVLLGAKTGRDGIGGVSVLASATFDGHGTPARRPSVQVGDPFTEKVLVECCLELYERGLTTAIQDLGGAGLTCALAETAAAGRSGMQVDLDRVPLREASMAAHEVLVSESQERMLATVAPAALPAVLEVCRRWGVLATPIGEVTGSGRLVVRWRGSVVADVPPASLADDGPVYERPLCPPAELEVLRADDPLALPRPADLRAELLRMVASPNLCSKRWVTEQYDRYVQGDTVLAWPEDAGVLRLSGTSGLGVALATDGNGRYARLDPYAGAQLALAEAARNVATVGARPVAVTNCLNFGSPEDPGVMWQFAQACRGLADACRELGVPVTGGNVSFYNQTGSDAVNPTPVVGVLGVLDNVARRVPTAFAADGDVLLLLGVTRPELGGSEWAWVAHRHLGGRPPAVDLRAEKLLQDVLVAAARDGLLSAAHDLSEGGLAQALVESCLAGGRGARVELAEGADPFVEMFSESAARAVVAVPPGGQRRLAGLCAARGVPYRRIGVVGGPALEVAGVLGVPLAELRAAHEGTLPRLFG
ncbi:MAG TPA: phosphoribosylformylglycinamidine synthase subunit PurL [Frankiaceae bacterium]|nr:phosphoribosylformylglycinamidine synthase subunit PurL [Frankiaceae bacterium]